MLAQGTGQCPAPAADRGGFQVLPGHPRGTGRAGRAGQAVLSDRKIVDDSFDVAILVIVPDQKRLAEYLDHPIHQKAKKDTLLPLVDRIVVYDFKE